MDKIAKLKDTMIAAGFSESLISVYSYLLLRESASLDQIAKDTGLWLDTARQEVDRLLELQVIAFDLVRKKYILYALDPDVVWNAFIKGTSWKFVNTLTNNDVDILMSNLPENHRIALQHFRESVDAIRKAALELYSGTTFVKIHRWRETIDANHMSQVLAESIQQAKSRIRAVSKSPRLPHVALIWESLLSRLKESIPYQRVADLTEVTEHGLDVVRRDVEQVGIDLRVLDTNDIEHKFYLVDKSLVIVFHTTGLREDGATIGRVTDQSAIINRYQKRFEKYYNDGIPAQFVIDMLSQSGYRLLERADTLRYKPNEIDWLQGIIALGTFCLKEDPFSYATLHRAMDDGLVHRGTTGKLIASYDVRMKDIKAHWKVKGNQL
ncbi:hypothetical protein FBQ99_20510 [Chloroflexi bacterium CFX2]|nr:hypothetical protein [Chloroflexi bacterium CFX2]